MLIASPHTSVASVSAKNTRGLLYWLLVAMVFLYPVWPVFIEKKIGPLPSLTPQKLLTYALVGLCVLQVAFSSKHSERLRAYLAANADLAKWMGTLLGLKFLSCMFSLGPFYALNLFYYETLTTFGILFVVLVLVSSMDDLAPLFQAFIAAAFFIGIFAIVEAVAGKNILEPFIPTETGTLALIDKAREGARRLQGTFASPLALAEFCAMAIPIIVLAQPREAGKLRRLLVASGVLLMLAAIYGSRTRSALGVVMLALGTWGFIYFRSIVNDTRRNAVLRAILWFYGGIAMIGGIALVCYLIYSLASGFSIDQALGIAERSQTLYQGGQDARIAQLEKAIPKIIDSPFFGYGIGIGAFVVGFYGTQNMITLDSQLLITVVDSGIPAMIAWIGLLLSCSSKSLKLAKSTSGVGRQWSYAISFSMACVIFFTITSPLSDVFPLAFVLIGALMVLRREAARQAR